MAIVGGALMPKLQGMIIDLGSGVNDTQFWEFQKSIFSFFLPLLCFLFIAYYGKKIANQSYNE